MDATRNLQALSAFAALLLLAATCAYVFLFSGITPLDPGRPTFSGPPIKRLEASVPSVSVFTHFYINDENPFIPYHLRKAEKIANQPRTKQSAPPPSQVKPPINPVVVVEPPKRELKLPRLTPTNPIVPQCIGLVGAGESPKVLVRLPDDESATAMEIGTVIGGWRLIAVENGNQAHFRDPAGDDYVFPIGQGDLAPPQQLVQGDSHQATPAPAPPQPGPPGSVPQPHIPTPGTGIKPIPPPQLPRLKQSGEKHK